jgi:hypothetical protein
MKLKFFLFFSLPLFLNAQVYSGSYGKYKHKWTLKINPDSSIILIKNIDNFGYQEYTGSIKRTNDTLFTIQTDPSFSQTACRAIGDSVLYVSLDSTTLKATPTITILYPDKYTVALPTAGNNHLKIPLDKKHFDVTKAKSAFYISAAHRNPISKLEVLTRFEAGDEYGLEFYSEKAISFDIVIKKNKVRKIGKGLIEPFILVKQP